MKPLEECSLDELNGIAAERAMAVYRATFALERAKMDYSRAVAWRDDKLAAIGSPQLAPNEVTGIPTG